MRLKGKPHSRLIRLYTAVDCLERAITQAEGVLAEVQTPSEGPSLESVGINWSAFSPHALMLQLASLRLLDRELAAILVTHCLRALDAAREHIAQKIQAERPPLAQLEFLADDEENNGT